ncbi:MAG: GT4 family glycosyltransferase PelF [Spirochaetales bacterium]|nr:GT4 family glycosyltransferase PelF [Spirochaetales bacterium]
MAKPLRICIVLEGSYPFITGGVSAWVHDLISNLTEIDFVLYTISPEKDMPLRYTLPENVREHVDIALSDARKPGKGPRTKKSLFKQLKTFHQSIALGNTPNFESVINHIPEGYYLYHDAVTSNTGWELLSSANQRKNPLYPFVDYFWAWKSAHDMMFTILGAKAPEADIYHSVSTGFAGLAALAAKKRKRKPFLLTEHGLYHKEREMEIRKSDMIKGHQRDMWIGIYNNLSRIGYRNADYITALFEENRQKQLEQGAPEDKTEVIPNGIDITRYDVERELKEGFHVGLVGRVVPIKDIKTFILTAKIVLDAIPEARFYCIGPTDEDEAYYDDCVTLVKSLRIEDRFEFTGRANVLDYYKFLNVMMLTSVREAQPLVILEAYTSGIPFVSTRVGNVAEMLDYDDRFIASSKDAEKLASGVIFIHENPDIMKQLCQGYRNKVRSLYDINQLHARFNKLYTEIKERG